MKIRQDSLSENIKQHINMAQTGKLGESQFQKDQQLRGRSELLIKKSTIKDSSPNKKKPRRQKTKKFGKTATMVTEL